MDSPVHLVQGAQCGSAPCAALGETVRLSTRGRAYIRFLSPTLLLLRPVPTTGGGAIASTGGGSFCGGTPKTRLAMGTDSSPTTYDSSALLAAVPRPMRTYTGQEQELA